MDIDIDWFELLEWFITYSSNIFYALIIFFVGRWVAHLVKKMSGKALEKAKVEVSLATFLKTLIYYSIMAFVVIAALARIGVQTASLIAVMGAAGLAVAFSLRDTLSNFASGVMLIFIRAFKIGDRIEAAGEKGQVSEISLFNTTLITPDQTHVVIPNSKIFANNIKNFSYHRARRVEVVMSISYDDSIEGAKNAVLAILKAHPKIHKDPEPKVIVKALAESSVALACRGWVHTPDFWPVYWDLLEKLKVGLEEKGYHIPYPQSDIHLFQDIAK